MTFLRFVGRWLLRLVALTLLTASGFFAFQWAKLRPRCVIVCKTHNLHWSDDGAFLLTGSSIADQPKESRFQQYKTPFLVWDTHTGSIVHTMLQDVAGVEFYTFSNDDRHVIAYLGKGVARLVDWRNAQEWDIATEHANERTGFTFAPRGDWFYVYDPGQKAPHLLIDVAKRQIAVRLEGDKYQAHGFSADGARFYFWKDKRLHAWNTQTQQIDGSFAISRPMQFDRQDRRLVAAAADGKSLVVWDTTTFQPLAKIQVASPAPASQSREANEPLNANDALAWLDWPCEVVFSPSGNRLATFPNSLRDAPAGVLEFWEADSGRKLASLPLKSGSFGSHFVNDANFLSFEPGMPGRMLWRMEGISVPSKLIDAATARVVMDDTVTWGYLQQLNESVLIRLDEPKFWRLIDANTGKSISTNAHPFATGQQQFEGFRGIHLSSHDVQELYVCLYGKCRTPELPGFLERWLVRWRPPASGAVQVIERKTGQVSYQMNIGTDDWAYVSKDGATLMIYTEILDEDSKRPPPERRTFQFRFYDLHSVTPWLWAFAAPSALIALILLWRMMRSKMRTASRTP